MDRIVAFNPEISKALGGDIEATLMYCQLLYWSDKGGRGDGFIYKSKKELEEETTLTRRQQDRARQKLEEMGWIETKLKKADGAPTLHFKCLKAIEIRISTKGTNGLVQNVLMEKPTGDQSLTESTTKNTNKNIIAAVPAAKKEGPNLVNELIKVFYDGGSGSANFKNKTHRAAAEWVIKKLGFPEAVMLAQKAMKLVKSGDPYVPKADNVFLMKEKLVALQTYGTKESPKKPTFTRSTL